MMTFFQHKVLDVVRKIPRGSVLTYGQVAELAGFPGAARAVGSVMKTNFDESVPCHRVIRSDGQIGKYNRGGVMAKTGLLEKEGAVSFPPEGWKGGEVENRMIIVNTLCMIVLDGQILLGLKKRGFGTGKWNGFGGKVDQGESIEEAAMRELEEESGITAIKLASRGVLNFYFLTSPDSTIEMHIFAVDEFCGEATESEEMRPQWFAFDDIPYADMWPADQYWLPLFLAGHTVAGDAYFGADNTLIKHTIHAT